MARRTDFTRVVLQAYAAKAARDFAEVMAEPYDPSKDPFAQDDPFGTIACEWCKDKFRGVEGTDRLCPDCAVAFERSRAGDELADIYLMEHDPRFREEEGSNA